MKLAKDGDAGAGEDLTYASLALSFLISMQVISRPGKPEVMYC
jgi:hypothetical protein